TTAYTMIDAVSSHCLQKRDIGTLPPRRAVPSAQPHRRAVGGAVTTISYVWYWTGQRCGSMMGRVTFNWGMRLLSDFRSTLICEKEPSSSAWVMLWFTYATMTIQTTAYTMIDAVSSHCLQKRDIGTLPPDGPSHRHSRTDGTCAARRGYKL